MIKKLQKYADRWWYPPLIGALAFADLFLLIIPTDGILVGAVILAPKRWVFTGLTVALGSALGSAALAYVLQLKGMPFLLDKWPGIDHTHAWIWASELMHKWGDWGVFFVALSPSPQHPAVALAALAGISLFRVFAAVFAGRAVKYLLIAWIASHSPKLLKKLWGMQYELKKLDNKSKDHEPK
jgi:membrane protein YqaA with SNARE-associated domain